MSDSPEVVLYIDRSSSTCGACGKTCLPDEKIHETPCGYDQHPGCGAHYTLLSSNYAGGGIEDAARRMRPDLQWIDYFSSLLVNKEPS